MNIAELFVNLSLKGAEKTAKGLKDIGGGFKDIKSLSLEAKAGIVGAVYALERLFSASGQRGTDLSNLNSLINVSTKDLQQYAYAARQVGVSNQDVEGTFKALQSTMTKTLMGEGAPKGLARVSQLTGGMTADDIKKFAEAPQLLIQKLQDYAQKETNTGLKNEVLKSFVNDNMIAALNKNAFTPQALQKAPTYSDKEVNALDRANIAWSNLGNKIEMAVGRFNALHGGQLVRDISLITDSVIKLAEALVKLSENFKLFEKIGNITKGLTGFLTGEGSKLVSERAKIDYGKDANTFDEMKVLFRALIGDMGPREQGTLDKLGFEIQKSIGNTENSLEGGLGLGDKLGGILPKIGSSLMNANQNGVARPNAPAVAPTAGNASTQNININQNLNFQHDGTDAKKIGDSTKKAVRDAFRQNPAQAQVN